MIHGIKQIHGAYPQQPNHHQGQEQIESPKSLGYLRDSREETFVRNTRTCCLRIKHLRRDSTKDRQQGHREDNHTDTTLPLRQTPPKKNAMRQPLNIGQDRRTGGRETRHGLKKGIRDIINIPTQQERQHAKEREKNPNQGDNQHALSPTRRFLLGLKT